MFALWKNKSKDGKKTYLSSKELIGFYNTKKKNPKEPDLRVYALNENKDISKEPVCSLWCNVSEKTKKKYLTGEYNGKKVVGFIYEGENEKAPYLSVYYREDGNTAQEEANQKKEEFEEIGSEDLPF